MITHPLVQAFEQSTIDPSTFNHREHLRVAWHYLQDLALEEALARYVHHLRKLVAALGVPHKFHRTMTWGYLVLLDEAMQRSPGVGFDELLTLNPALLERASLLAHYEREQLDSLEARTRFVLPRRA